ncbi:PREDICTED: uncharacterized protein LOC109116824, partial [Tarenaya hassleriana]|uniref:uncharacterized protein LOC109116824 n=1 Tax=Tarenaya hassleriana TaxID=28532 RepID=UPI0008FD5287
MARLNVLVYVDDLIVTGSSSELITRFKEYMAVCFYMKDLGPLRYFLGIEVARSQAGIYLCQRKYTLDIISDSGLLGAKPALFPLDQNHQLARDDSPLLADPEPYRRLIGRLIYLVNTRPDLGYSVQLLSQFMQSPREAQWDAALRVVRYLKKNPGQGILLRSSTPLRLTGWCDSDYGADPVKRRSLTGWFVQLGDSPISWKTKKQATLACSSAEAEYRAMASTTRELVWLRQLLCDLGVSLHQPIQLNCDSQAAIHISSNPVFHERTKHIEIDCHYVRDQIEAGILVPRHVNTRLQLADIFTKAL